jgi:hypothetical protein
MYLVFDPTVSPHYEVVLDGVPSIRIVFIFRLWKTAGRYYLIDFLIYHFVTEKNRG